MLKKPLPQQTELEMVTREASRKDLQEVEVFWTAVSEATEFIPYGNIQDLEVKLATKSFAAHSERGRRCNARARLSRKGTATVSEV